MNMKPFRFGPIPLSAVLTTNLLNPPAAAGGVNGGASPQYILLRHVRVVNRANAVVNYSLWLGGSNGNVAGTEVIAQQKQVAAFGVDDWYAGGPGMRIDAADFLVGGASAANSLTIEGEGEIGVAG